MQRADVRARARSLGRFEIKAKKEKKEAAHGHTHVNIIGHANIRQNTHTYTKKIRYARGVAGDGLPILAGGFHLRTGGHPRVLLRIPQ